jgi:hypothetical protein
MMMIAEEGRRQRCHSRGQRQAHGRAAGVHRAARGQTGAPSGAVCRQGWGIGVVAGRRRGWLVRPSHALLIVPPAAGCLRVCVDCGLLWPQSVVDVAPIWPPAAAAESSQSSPAAC